MEIEILRVLNFDMVGSNVILYTLTKDLTQDDWVFLLVTYVLFVHDVNL